MVTCIRIENIGKAYLNERIRNLCQRILVQNPTIHDDVKQTLPYRDTIEKP